MEIVEFFKTSSVHIIAGKGGVGKTTVTAALGELASRNGLKTTIVSLEGKTGLCNTFDLDNQELKFESLKVNENLDIRLITPDEALVEYLDLHGMKRISKRLVSSGLLDIVATAIPGIKDILILGKIKQLERAAQQDVILVDAPATGHALTFLTSAKGLLNSARSGPVRDQANDVLAMLSDSSRCQVMLVTLAEETPVNETIQAAFELEDKVGIKLGPAIVNGLFLYEKNLNLDFDKLALLQHSPQIDDKTRNMINAALFYNARSMLQKRYIQRLEKELPLAYLTLPILFVDEMNNSQIQKLATILEDQIINLSPKIVNV